MSEKAQKVVLYAAGLAAGWVLLNLMKKPKVKVVEEVTPPPPAEGSQTTWHGVTWRKL